MEKKMINQGRNEVKKSQVLLPVLLSAIAIPVSMLFWIINVVYSNLTPEEDSHYESNLLDQKFICNYLLKNLFFINLFYYSHFTLEMACLSSHSYYICSLGTKEKIT